MQHLSLRLVWHDRGWDGCVCDNPKMNVYCQGQFSVQGDHIREEKDATWETTHHGQSCAEIWSEEKRLPPCTWTINSFSQNEMPHVHEHPFFDSAKPKLEIFPEFSTGTWAMDQMYDPRSKQIVAEFEQREQNIRSYFDQFTEGKSLVFFYLNYDNPLTSEEKQYVLVGISTLKKFGPYLSFDGLSEWEKKTSGDRVWSRYVRSAFDTGQGVRIPYQEYLKSGKKPNELTPILVKISGELERRFKYVSRPLSDDDACELIQRTIESIGKVANDGLVAGDWPARLEWLNSILGTTWHDRGLYPGLGSVLEVLGMREGTAFVRGLSKNMKEDLRDYVFGALEGKSQSKWANKAKSVWEQYSATKRKLLRRLCSFDLTAEQIDKIVSERTDLTGITSSLDTILANPYCIGEEYSGNDEDDVIGFYRIDNGLVPLTSLQAEAEIELDDPSRIRALMIEKLRSEKKATGNCFLELTDLIDYIESKQVEWRRFPLSKEKVLASRAFYEEKNKLAFFEHDSRVFVYLQSIHNDEQLIRQRIDKLVAKQYAASGVNWKAKLNKTHQNIPEEIYAKVLEQQSDAVENCFRRKLSVIAGSAGTGKTTVLKALIEEIQRNQRGATFLLLAPTGKARENLGRQTGMSDVTMTIHSALKSHGWLAKKTYRYVENKKKMIEASHIIIDEASMIDLELLAHLFRSIQWALVERLILVGDKNQLPPIGFGRPFFDIINYLETVHRGAVKHLTINCRQLIQESNILKLASMYTETPDKDFDAILNRIEKNQPLGPDMESIFWESQMDLVRKVHARVDALLKDEGASAGTPNFTLDNLLNMHTGKEEHSPFSGYSIDYFQILSPYRGDFFGTGALNEIIQERYRAASIRTYGFMEGLTTYDKVIQVRNTSIYSEGDFCEVYNGQLGYVFYVPGPGKKRTAIGVNLSTSGAEEPLYYKRSIIDSNLEPGYAITVHKSQGSEFQEVFLILPREDSGFISRELLYTALTRSRKKLVLFLQKDIQPLMAARHSARSAILLRNTSIFTFRFISEKYRANDLIHRTSKGEYVRSKSELIIANILFDKSVFYKYEEPLLSKDGSEWKLPDFTIRTEDGDTYYWEHLGRLEHDPQYAEDWEEKKDWYKRNGYFDRLIWSDEIGGFDSKKVEKLINEKLAI